MGQPREALELLLTDDADEARKLAQRLEEVNRERQAVEDRILRSAVAQIESWPENKRRRHGYALADADWHEGVIGIVASRLVERYHRPVVLIAGGEDAWKGSGRSVGAFDLHEALSACSDHLLRWGGHRAAAGLSIDPSEVDAFARVRRARGRNAVRRRARACRFVDAIVPRGLPLTLDLAQELAQLAPFGLGNPGVTLLAPSCELRDLGTVGDGKHSSSAFAAKTAATPAARSRSGSGRISTACAVWPASTSSSGSKRTGGTAPSLRNSSCAACSTRRTVTKSSRRGYALSGSSTRAIPPRRTSSTSCCSRAASSAACSSQSASVHSKSAALPPQRARLLVADLNAVPRAGSRVAEGLASRLVAERPASRVPSATTTASVAPRRIVCPGKIPSCGCTSNAASYWFVPPVNRWVIQGRHVLQRRRHSQRDRKPLSAARHVQRRQTAQLSNCLANV
jgi:hypothetical protein